MSEFPPPPRKKQPHMSLAEVGAELGVSAEMVRQVEKGALEKRRR